MKFFNNKIFIERFTRYFVFILLIDAVLSVVYSTAILSGPHQAVLNGLGIRDSAFEDMYLGSIFFIFPGIVLGHILVWRLKKGGATYPHFYITLCRISLVIDYLCMILFAYLAWVIFSNFTLWGRS